MSNNAATNFGGGIYGIGSTTLTDSTLADNSAGGGIISGGTLTLAESTLTGNAAPTGGGIDNTANSTTAVVLVNTIVAGNFSGAAPPATASDVSGTVAAANSANNLIGTGGLTNGSNGNLVGVANPGLGTLGDYGGPTQTIPPLPGSPAIDSGDNALNNQATDQRGVARIINGTIDIGAFESRGFIVTAGDGSTPQSATVNSPFANPLAVNVVSIFGEPVAGGVVSFRVIPINGASATLNAASATVDANGRAAVTASANNVAGNELVIASAIGGNTTIFFNLTNLAAVITGVSVGWGTVGTASLVTVADGLRLLPAGRSTDLPWLAIQRITPTLSGPGTLTAADVSVAGLVGVNYGPVTVSGSGSTYTITLAQPIDLADRVTLTAANAAVATFTRRLDVLPGVVNAQDVALERDAVPADIPNVIDDIDGNGAVNLDDYNLVRRKVNTKLPALA